ncbi:MAG: 16S rRNA (cytosine(1402)-N(4))-methyltransferase RsmH [Bacilli bacterium]|nr:16S rRNA (cytosine(1402)-N(4))-methyltransferase RsmH [Bacilli bacterium]
MVYMKHISVLLEEVIENLNIKEDGKYVDGTVGYAGHSSEVLKRLSEKGFLFAFDQDDDAIAFSNEKLSKIGNNFTIFRSNFKNMNKFINEKVDGIMFDLGVSSPQLDEDERGFSFHKDARLDMRMDRTQELDAYKVVNEYSYDKLVSIFFKYGEEKHARSIAKAIVNKRPIETTLELAEIIKNSVPISYRNKSHPARKVFQAIRIEVNHELDILENALRDAFELLNVGGRLSVISFHSLEDKIVSKVFKDLCSDDESARKLPITPEHLKARAKKIIKITPSEKELDDNNRSRSSKLRVIERVR